MWITSFYSSAIGKKAVMAVSGAFLFGWIVLHALGNLKLYFGAESFNNYAAWLRVIGSPALANGSVLWTVRAALVIAAWLHIQAATQLTLQSRRARPVDYGRRLSAASTYAARTIRWSGVLILLFVIYHLLHLTFGTVHPDFHPNDVYWNVVRGFQVWPVSAFYIVGNLALGLHLCHGLWSMFASLGAVAPPFDTWRRRFAMAAALIITAVNVSFPLAVLIGVVR